MPVPSWLSTDPAEPKLPPRTRPGWAPRPGQKVQLMRGWEVPEGAGQETTPSPYAGTDAAVNNYLTQIGNYGVPGAAEQAPQALQAPNALTPTPTPTATPTVSQAPQPTAQATSQPTLQENPDTPIQAQRYQSEAASPTGPSLGQLEDMYSAPLDTSGGATDTSSIDTSDPNSVTDTTDYSTSGSNLGPGPQSKTAGDLIDQARQAAAKYGIDPDVFARQIQQESGFNANARSPAGAIGIAQFMPDTAKGLGIDPTNAQQSLDGAAKLDAQYLSDYGGDYRLMLAAYNAGPGAVAKYGGVPPYKETQSYVGNIYGSGSSTASGRPGSGGGSTVLKSGTSLVGTKTQVGLLQAAKSAVGSPYQFGGAGGRNSQTQLSPTDCSGFVSWAYQQGAGIKLPAQTQAIWDGTTAIDASQAQPGDLVMYNMDQSDPHLQHVGIYVGHGQMIHDSSANPNGGVDISALWSNPSFRRVPGATPEQLRGIRPDSQESPVQLTRPQQDRLTSWQVISHAGRQMLVGQYASGKPLSRDLGKTSAPDGTVLQSMTPEAQQYAQSQLQQQGQPIGPQINPGGLEQGSDIGGGNEATPTLQMPGSPGVGIGAGQDEGDDTDQTDTTSPYYSGYTDPSGNVVPLPPPSATTVNRAADLGWLGDQYTPQAQGAAETLAEDQNYQVPTNADIVNATRQATGDTSITYQDLTPQPQPLPAPAPLTAQDVAATQARLSGATPTDQQAAPAPTDQPQPSTPVTLGSTLSAARSAIQGAPAAAGQLVSDVTSGKIGLPNFGGTSTADQTSTDQPSANQTPATSPDQAPPQESIASLLPSPTAPVTAPLVQPTVLNTGVLAPISTQTSQALAKGQGQLNPGDVVTLASAPINQASDALANQIVAASPGLIQANQQDGGATKALVSLGVQQYIYAIQPEVAAGDAAKAVSTASALGDEQSHVAMLQEVIQRLQQPAGSPEEVQNDLQALRDLTGRPGAQVPQSPPLPARTGVDPLTGLPASLSDATAPLRQLLGSRQPAQANIDFATGGIAGGISRLVNQSDAAAEAAADFAQPGELSRLPFDQLPNRDVLAGADGVEARPTGDGGGYRVSATAPATAETAGLRQGDPNRIRQVISDLVPNPRIPWSNLQNSLMETFLDARAAMRDRIASGEIQPESLVPPDIGAMGSIGRGATDFTRAFQPGGIGEEGVQRMLPTFQTQVGPTAATTRGLTWRPEISWATSASDTTNPAVMGMLTAITRPSVEEGAPLTQASFMTVAEKQGAIEAGLKAITDQQAVYGHGKLMSTSDLIAGNQLMRMGMRVGQAGGGWAETWPQKWQVLQDWATSTGEFSGLAPRDATATLLEKLSEPGTSLRGLGQVKTRFATSMSVDPGFATLDTRMLRDVFGLDPKTQLTPAEYSLLEQKLMDTPSATKYLYGKQWLPWEFLSGETTDYTSLSQSIDRVNSFAQQAVRDAAANDTTVGEAAMKLAGEQAKMPIAHPINNPETVARIGISPERVKALPMGTQGSKLVKDQIPELDNFARQAGVSIEGKPAVSAGGWLSDSTGQMYREGALDLQVRGNVSNVRFFAASLLAGYPKEESAMVVYTSGVPMDGKLATLNIQGVQPGEAAAIEQLATQYHPQGWTIRSVSKGGDMQLTIAAGKDDVEQLNRVAASLQHRLESAGYKLTPATISPAALESIDRSQINDIIYGGPRGAYRPPQSAGTIDEGVRGGGLAGRGPPPSGTAGPEAGGATAGRGPGNGPVRLEEGQGTAAAPQPGAAEAAPSELTLSPEQRQAAIRDALPAEIRNTPQGQAITAQVSSAADPGPVLEQLGAQGKLPINQAVPDMYAPPVGNNRLSGVVGEAPHTAAAQTDLLQRAALDLNDDQLLSDSRVVKAAAKHEPLSPRQLRNAITSAVKRQNPGMDVQQIAQRVDGLLNARQEARATTGFAIRGAVGAAGGYASYEAAMQNTAEDDPNRQLKAYAAGIIGGAAAVALPYLGGFLKRATLDPATRLIEDEGLQQVMNKSARYRELHALMTGGVQSGKLAGELFRQQLDEAFRGELNAAELSHWELNNAVSPKWQGNQLAEDAFKKWQDIAKSTPTDVNLKKQINFSNPTNAANLYVPHVLDEEWKNAQKAVPVTDSGKAASGLAGLSQNPMWAFKKTRSFDTMAEGVANGMVYTDEGAKLLGDYYARAKQEVALQNYAKGIRDLAKSGTDPMLYTSQDAGQITRQYNAGWKASENYGAGKGTNDPLGDADMRNAPKAWYAGYEDHAVGRPKGTSKPQPPKIDVRSGTSLGQYLPGRDLQNVYATRPMADLWETTFGKPSGLSPIARGTHEALGSLAVVKHNMFGLSLFHGTNVTRQFGTSLPAIYAQYGMKGVPALEHLPGATSQAAKWARFSGELLATPARFAYEMGQSMMHTGTAGAWRAFQVRETPGMIEAANDLLTLNMNSAHAIGWKRQMAITLFNAVGGGAAGYKLGQTLGMSPEQSALMAAGGAALGAATGAPVFGGKSMITAFNDSLFSRYIPYLKYRTYQLLKGAGMGGRAAAEYANNAFGGQNLMAMGRSRTVQDAARFAGLAPDFEEGVAKQWGNAMFNWHGPQGTMNRMYWGSALVGGAAMLELGNLAFGGHMSWDNDPSKTLEWDMSNVYKLMGWKSVDPKTGQPTTPYLPFLGPWEGQFQALQELSRASAMGIMQAYKIPVPDEISGNVQKGIPHPDPIGALERVAGARAGLLPRAAIEQVLGYDYTGQPLDVASDPFYKNVGRRVVASLQGALPTGPSQAAQSLQTAGTEGWGPAIAGAVLGVAGFRPSRADAATRRLGVLDQWMRDNGIAVDQQQQLADGRTAINQGVDDKISQLLADSTLTPEVSSQAQAAGTPRSQGLISQIISAQQGRESEYKQLLGKLNQRYGLDPQYDPTTGAPPPDGYENQYEALKTLFSGAIQGGTNASADLSDRPDLDAEQLYQMAWQPQSTMGLPQQVLADLGIQAPDWLPNIGAQIDPKDTKAINNAHEVQVQKVAGDWNVDPAVMEDVVKAHLYGDGTLPQLPGMTSANLDQVTSDYYKLSQEPSGPDRTAAQQKVISDAAAAYGVDPENLRQRVVWRELPMVAQSQPLKDYSNATTLDSKTRVYTFANPDGTPWGTVQQEQTANQLLAAARQQGRYKAGSHGFPGTYLNASKDDVDPKLQALAEAQSRGTSAKAAALQSDPNWQNYDRFYGRGKYLTNDQWAQFQAGTMPGAFSDIGTQYPNEFKYRIGLLDQWAKMTPEQRYAEDQPQNVVLLMPDDFTGQLSRQKMDMPTAIWYLTNAKSPSKLRTANLTDLNPDEAAASLPG